MAAVASGAFDFSKTGKYPVILSDALLGKPSKDTVTAIRYNHKPDPSSSSTGTLNLSPSDEDPTSYDLSFKDQSGRYEYAGSRTSGDGQYVLIFDRVKKHFVLHRVDSTFDMNLVSAPWDQDAEALRSQYSQLDPQPKANSPSQQRKASKLVKPAAPLKTTSAPKAPLKAPPKAAPKRQKVEKPKKKPVREPSPEEEEDDDSDDGLLIEYPDGPPPSKFNYTSTPIFQEAISEASEEDEDAEGELEDEGNMDVDLLQLPSPANNAGGLSPEDLELDLEAELERALESNNGDESDESEEE